MATSMSSRSRSSCQMIAQRVLRGEFEPPRGPYRDTHFLIPKKNGKYHFLISAMIGNRHTLEDARILPYVEEYPEAFAGLPISSLNDFDYGYNQQTLYEDCQDYRAFQTTQGIYRPTRLVQGAANSASAYVRLSRKILNALLGSIAESFVHDVGVQGPMSQHREEVVEGLPGVRGFVIEHLQNLDDVLAEVERAGATISGETSDWCWNRVQIVLVRL